MKARQRIKDQCRFLSPRPWNDDDKGILLLDKSKDRIVSKESKAEKRGKRWWKSSDAYLLGVGDGEERGDKGADGAEERLLAGRDGGGDR